MFITAVRDKLYLKCFKTVWPNFKPESCFLIWTMFTCWSYSEDNRYMYFIIKHSKESVISCRSFVFKYNLSCFLALILFFEVMEFTHEWNCIHRFWSFCIIYIYLLMQWYVLFNMLLLISGVFESTIRRIVDEDMTNGSKFVTPGKHRKGRPKKQIDDFDMCGIRQKVHFSTQCRKKYLPEEGYWQWWKKI